MAWHIGTRKGAEVLQHLDQLGEAHTRGIALRMDAQNAKTKLLLDALASYEELSHVRSLQTLQSTLERFAQYILAQSDADAEFDALVTLYIAKASAVLHQLMVDNMADTYASIAPLLEYWVYEDQHPLHYIICSIPHRFLKFYRLVTDHPHTPRSPITNLWARLRALQLTYASDFRRVVALLCNPLQLKFMIRHTFSDRVRSHIRNLCETEAMVVEQLGYTYQMLTAPLTTTSIQDLPALTATHIHHTGALLAGPARELTHPSAPAEPLPPSTAIRRLQNLCSTYNQHHASVVSVLAQTQPRRSRYWWQVGLGVYFGYRTCFWYLRSTWTWSGVGRWTKRIFQDCWTTYLKEPLSGIMQILFKEREDHRGKEAYLSELELLNKMVLAYHLEEGPLSEAERSEILSQLAAGNLASISTQYEDRIKHPIRSILTQDLSRLLFIQLQQQKVNITRLYISMDEVMTANELNFQLMAAVPAAMLCFFLIYLYFTRQRMTVAPVYRRLRRCLRGVEVIMNQPNGRLTWAAEGYLIVQLNRMRVISKSLSAEHLTLFSEDLLELEDPRRPPQSRLHTIQRMYHTHGWLWPQVDDLK
eukprot:NODE_799_length_1858_cov_43.540728_g746_i0.p1 GENE.NODE_799_length_1858_cov_43.540728_g746_i0~~NODE_799_length_1858_cov_43.540728_g746_i0.p1  ORF type:complete len:603 (+),score=144.94 NODE_799_length_1858_cov_43.540728_g746_i0:44-1810(+)